MQPRGARGVPPGSGHITRLQCLAERVDELDYPFEATPAGDVVFAGDGELRIGKYGITVALAVRFDTAERSGITGLGIAEQVFGLVLVLFEVGTEG